MVARRGMHGCSGGLRGFIWGGMHGFIWGACMVLFGGGVHGFIPGACMVLFGGCAWFYSGACMVLFRGACMVLFSRGACVVLFSGGACMVLFSRGGMHQFFGYNEIRSMSGRYASYWNAFLSFIRKPKAEKISAGSLCPAYNMCMDGKEISRVPVGSCMLPDCYSV